MVITIFYAVCGLGIFFFVGFFLQCCRSASRKTRHVIRDLAIDDSFASAQTTRMFAQWEREMAEFMTRQGRTTAFLFLMAATSVASFRSPPRSAQSDSTVTKLNQRASFNPDRTATLDRSQPAHTLCQKN